MRRVSLFLGAVVLLSLISFPLVSETFAAEQRVQVLNPRGFMPEVQLVPLAARPADLNNKTVYLITSKQEGSHIEVVLAKVAEELTKRYPGIKIINRYKPSGIHEQ